MRSQASRNIETGNLEAALPLTIWQAIKDPVQVLDRDYRIVWCNTCQGENGTIGPAELIGRRCFKAFFKRSTPCPDCPLAETFASGVGQVKEKMIPLAGGGVSWRQVHSYPLIGPDGTARYVFKIGFDITDKKREQARNRKYLRNLLDQVQGSGQEQDAPGQGQKGSEQKLTTRELEVLRLMAQGFTNRNIAEILAISLNTVKTHVAHIFDKLEVGDRAKAAVIAVKLNLI